MQPGMIWRRGYTCLVCAILAALPAAAQGPPRATPVVVTPVTTADVPPSIRLVGTVLADRRAVIAAEVDGIIAEFVAQEGQFLHAAEVICRIDPEVPRLRLAEAEAELAQRRATLEELEAGERAEDIQRLEAIVGELEAVLDKWEFERKWVAGLAANAQATAKEQHDVEMEVRAAQRRLTAAQAARDKARNGARPEELARARQAVHAQEAAVGRLQRDLEKAQIRAPFDGFVVTKRTEIGEWIDGGGPVCEMVAIETVKIRVDAPEHVIPFAVAGAPASVEVDALQASRAARIARVIPLAAAGARTFPIEIDLPNEKHELLPGMFVWANVPAGPPGQRLMASRDALVARGTAKQVFVIRPGADGANTALPLNVTTGLEIAGAVEIQAAGLQPGDLLVSRGNERLYGPTPVTFEPPAAASASSSAPASPDGPPQH